MKVAVIGGTGLIGSRLVKKLRAHGHDALAASRRTGVDVISGKGLAEALAGAQVVVDVSNATDWSDAAVMDFFQTSAQNLLAAEAAAEVGHHVALSVVGTERLQASGYFRAKLAQEQALKAAAIPSTILRATQFFEFTGAIANFGTYDGTVLLPPVLFQPESADDVAAALADIAENAAVNGTVELGGPERFRLDELVRRYLSAKRDPRQVVTDVHAPYYGIEIDERALIPADNSRIGVTRFADWLSRSATELEPGETMSTPGGNAFLHGLELDVRAELVIAETNEPEEEADGVPDAELLLDPDAERYEVALRALLGAVEAVQDAPLQRPNTGQTGPDRQAQE